MKSSPSPKATTLLAAAIASPVLITAIAFAIRAGLTVFHLHHTDFHDLITDDLMYNVARSIVRGHGFSSPAGPDTGPTAFFTPVYPYILAGIFKLFGADSYRSIVSAAMLDAIFSASTCIPIFFVAKRFGGRPLGAVAAWLWAILPLGISLPDVYVWYEALSTLQSAFLMWATLALWDSEDAAAWSGYGALWGFALLTNASLMSLPPFLFAWLAWKRRRHGLLWSKPLAFAGVLLVLVCSPWVVRNYLVFHRFIPLRSNLGLELWAGNHDESQPHETDTEFFASMRNGEYSYFQSKGRQSLEFMREHPAEEVRLIAGRVLRTWLGTSRPIGDFFANDWVFRGQMLFCMGLSLATLGGLRMLYGQDPETAWAMAIFPAIFPLVYYATHMIASYRLPIDPAIVVLAAVALWRPPGQVRSATVR